ncbi:phosphohistidine phosphatase [Catalinimonas alkaloidigena]|uniref:SixA phosphatase family protein n=1 Tax=Catalinimonas alkaloidigena TaxID=1075417 RepID=UPI0024060DF5|nr:histidine phosphatase family protein [Catalinimonas alkaloidigena]MDF9796719.1 phosphohistidine phosphatase [Catalinimonas alkaloidigena]
MVKKLFLGRHAESAEAVAGIKDIERDLTAKGYRDAPRVGKYLFEQNLLPDTVISSSAQRAKATAELMAEQLKYELHKINFSDDLYNASVRTLLKVVNEEQSTCNHLILLAHNPAISYLAEYLSNENIGSIVAGGMIILNFDIGSWEEVSEGNGEFYMYIQPDQIIF